MISGAPTCDAREDDMDLNLDLMAARAAACARIALPARAARILTDDVPALIAECRRLDALCAWQRGELHKRMACVTCGAEPRRCFQCAEPLCPVCGDRDGIIMRARDLLTENAALRRLL